MSKSVLIMDQHFRQVEELFRPAAFTALKELCDVRGAVNWPMAHQDFLDSLPEAAFVVAAHPRLDSGALKIARNLKAIIEVSGTFQAGLDYAACFETGIEVLSCAPGFRQSVAEMALGLMIAGARGIVEEHERFRTGSERWLDDNIGTDFTLYGQKIGFVGFGSIARECARLLAPFEARISAFDPWLQASPSAPKDITFAPLEEVVSESRCLVIAATPTDQNRGLLSRDLIQRLPKGTLVVVISRAHLVDFDALTEAADKGRIRLASDVFPEEPVSKRSPVRATQNVIWSPHRAAAVEGGRQPIGDMIVHDVHAILDGRSDRRLQVAAPGTVDHIVRAPLATG